MGLHLYPSHHSLALRGNDLVLAKGIRKGVIIAQFHYRNYWHHRSCVSYMDTKVHKGRIKTYNKDSASLWSGRRLTLLCITISTVMRSAGTLVLVWYVSQTAGISMWSEQHCQKILYYCILNYIVKRTSPNGTNSAFIMTSLIFH